MKTPLRHSFIYLSRIFLCLLFAFPLSAQPWEWAKRVGASENSFYQPAQIATDAEGNSYLVGDFSGSADFGNGVTLTTNGGINAYLLKINTNGQAQWALRASGGSTNGFDVAVAPDGKSVYLLGGFFSSTTLGSLTISQSNNSGQSLFVAKVSAEGTPLWGVAAGGDNNQFENRSSLTVDPAGNVYLNGFTFSNGVKVGTKTVENTFGFDSYVYLAKLSTTGEVLWAKGLISDNDNFNFYFNRISMAATTGKLLAIGQFYFRIQIGSAVYQISDTNFFYSGFLAEINTETGAVSHSRILTEGLLQSNNSTSRRLTIDKNGNYSFVGEFSGGINIYPKTGEPINIATASNGDVFVAKFNPNHEITFVRSFGGVNYDSGLGIASDQLGNLYVTGGYTDNITFGTYKLKEEFEANFQQNIYAAKYDDKGNEVWIRSAGGSNFDYGYSIGIDNQENAYITGYFTLAAIFDKDTIASNTFNNYSFVSKIGCTPLKPKNILGDSIVCLGSKTYTAEGFRHNYNWTVSGGGTIASVREKATVEWTQTGTYTLTATPFASCGSGPSVSKTITVIDIPKNTPIEGATLACVGTEIYRVPREAGTTYTWEITGGGSIIEVENSSLINWQLPGQYTVSVTGTNACGSSTKRSMIVKVDQQVTQPSPIGGNNNVCLGTQTYTVTNATNGTLRWELTGGGSLITNGGVATINWTEPGQHTLSVVTVGSCGESAQRNLTVNVRRSPLQPSVILGSTNVCPGFQENYGINAEANVSYVWSLTGGGVLQAQGNAAVVNWSSIGTHTLTVIPSNECGPGIARSINITVRSIPQQTPEIVGLTNVCQGEQTYLVPKENGVNYTWTLSGGGTIVPSSNTAKVDWKQAGTYTLTVTPENSCGKGTSRSLLVTVSAVNQQSGQITGSVTGCTGTASTYSVPSVTGFNYNWNLSGGGVLTPNGSQVTVNWNTAGLHTLSVNTSDGCAKSITVEVSSLPAQPVAINGSTEVCPGSVVYNVPEINGVAYEWQLSSGGTLNTSFNLASVNWTSPGTHTLTVVPKNTCGSGLSRTIQVVVKPLPVQPAEISGNLLACLSAETYRISAQANVTYEWSLDSGGTLQANANEVTINWLETGEHKLSVKVSNSCGTSATRSVTVNVAELPMRPTIAGTQNLCLGVQEYSVVAEPNVTYNWSVGSGGTFETFGNTIVVNWTTPGSHVITATPSNRCGVGETRSLQVNVFEDAEIPGTIEGDRAVCLGFASYTVPNQAGSAYTWSLSGGGSIAAAGNVANINWINSGEFTLSVTPSNACGTGETKTISIKVSQAPLLTLGITGATQTCLSRTNYATNLLEGVTYNWALSGGGVLAPNGHQAEVEWTTPGTHTLTVTPSNACGTGGSRSVLVTVSDIPVQPVFNNAPVQVCLSEQTYSVLNVQGVTFNWQLSGGGTLTSNGNVAQVNWTSAGTHTLSVTPNNSCGTGETRTLSVVVVPNPVVPEIDGPLSVCLGQVSYSLQGQAGINYQWNLSSGGTLTAQGASAVVNWITVGTHSITITPVNFCGTGASKVIQVNVTSVPEQAGNINGKASVCKGESQTYSMVFLTGVDYNWELSGGGEVTEEANQLRVNWTQPGVHVISASPSNTCGTGQTRIFEVNVRDAPNLSGNILGETGVCRNDRVFYSVPNAEGVSYQWSLSGNGATLTSLENTALVDWKKSGTYTLTVTPTTSCGTGEAASIEVTVFEKPAAPVISIDNAGVLTSNQPDGNQWYLNELPIDGATEPTFQPEVSGRYSLKVSNPCEESDFAEGVYFTTKSDPEFGIVTYPNPANDYFTVELPYNLAWSELAIYDGMGRAVQVLRPEACASCQTTGSVYKIEVDARNFAEGIYYILVETELGQRLRKTVQVR